MSELLAGSAPPPAPVGAAPAAPVASAPPSAVAGALYAALSSTVRGKPDVLRLALTTLLSGGHLLLDDVPGTGKTLLAKSFAAAIGGRVGRVQCTPDLLPTDITGTSVFQPGAGTWEFRPGPVFADVVLLDEINRASPRTQSALLQPMEERQVTVDGVTYPLPPDFFCIATQNPLSQVGTFPLPESQLDRFAMTLSMGLPDREAEREIVVGHGGVDRLPAIAPVTDPVRLAATIAAVRAVHCAPAVIEYVLDLATATRHDATLAAGISPRVTTGLVALARAHAVISGREYVTPDDVSVVFVDACAHRVALAHGPDATAARPVLRALLGRVAVPRG